MATVNSVLGPVDTAALGSTLSHEHISIGAGGYPHSFPEFLDRDATAERAVRDLTEALEEGVGTIVDMAPHDQGRDVLLQLEQDGALQLGFNKELDNQTERVSFRSS